MRVTEEERARSHAVVGKAELQLFRRGDRTRGASSRDSVVADFATARGGGSFVVVGPRAPSPPRARARAVAATRRRPSRENRPPIDVPFHSSPVQSSPVQSISFDSSPFQSSPVQSSPSRPSCAAGGCRSSACRAPRHHIPHSIYLASSLRGGLMSIVSFPCTLLRSRSVVEPPRAATKDPPRRRTHDEMMRKMKSPRERLRRRSDDDAGGPPGPEAAR